jgi:hypothetical protein
MMRAHKKVFRDHFIWQLFTEKMEKIMELIYPMFAMVVLTTIVGAGTAYVRIKSAYAGEVDPRYFKLMSKYDVTDRVAKFGRNFDNLLEVPVLFYAACLSAMTLNLSSQLFLVLAWIFFFYVLRIRRFT